MNIHPRDYIDGHLEEVILFPNAADNQRNHVHGNIHALITYPFDRICYAFREIGGAVDESLHGVNLLLLQELAVLNNIDDGLPIHLVQ